MPPRVPERVRHNGTVTETQPPDRVIAGRYRLLSLVGHGSMGTVWRAYDEYLRRPVAVKEVRLPPGMPAEEADELRERTMREARAIAVLSHPNVVTLHDIAREDDNPFVVMEYVPGSSLADIMRAHGPLDDTQAAAVADAVASALQAAHQAGITHRDVKPANVLVAEDGRIKLADFGIARNISEHTLTSTGITLGSPAYIAPEVASGGAVTNAADLWSLGATLFAAVEGRAPYDPSGDVIATLLEVVNGDVPQPAHTGPIADVITGLMVKDIPSRLSLAEVRRRIYPLLPTPGTPVFTPDAIAHAEEESSSLPTKVTTAPSAPEQAPTDQPGLAADPGPLPFEPSPYLEEEPRRRGTPRAAVFLAAVVVFAVAATGAFVGARTVSGKSLLPPAPLTHTTPIPAPSQADVPVGEPVQRQGNAVTTVNEQGGGFTINVPPDWQMFEERRDSTGKNIGGSVRMHYISRDGRYQLLVERFVGFYGTPPHKIVDYVAALRATWPPGDYVESNQVSVADPPGPGGPETAQQLRYKTVDGREQRRTTFANAIPRGSDLWVVSLTVPTTEEDDGKVTFDKLAPSFAFA
jgi:serine/threonine protein kinase